MKKTITLLTSIFLITLLPSCSNDNENNEENPIIIDFEEENPLPGYLTVTGYNQQTTVYSNTGQLKEIGFFFKPLKKGHLNSIVAKLPTTNPALTIRIWDLQANAVIRTETINVTVANSEITKIITPLELVKNKDYAITMISDSYFKKNRTDLGTPNHPITIGNIKINGSYLGNSDPQDPSFVTVIGLYNGDCSFNFLQTE